jgi:tRNA nucleotidyltransferase/poly(A) polymerase
MRSFKQFIKSKSLVTEQDESSDKNWKKQFIKIQKGFIPPSNMRPIIQAFLDSNSIKIMNDTSKEINMPKKSLYLTGGSVRDFLKNKTIKNYNLVTDATPEQISLILKNSGFVREEKSENSKKYYRITSDGAIVYVNGDKFEIKTFKELDNKFTDNILKDAEGRDLTINSLYIELSKADGENTKLYDPTQKGWYDITQGNIKSNKNPEVSFKEDKLRMMRTVRFYSQYGKGPLDKNIQNAIKELRSEIKDLPKEVIKQEFLKGLMNPDIDPRKYLKNYNDVGLLDKIFPQVNLNLKMPPELSNKRDKILALAWILQDNSIDELKNILQDWEIRNAVVHLIKLKEFDINHINDFLQDKKISGVSEEQIKNWVDLFNVEGRSIRPKWSNHVKKFAKFKPDNSQLTRLDSDEFTNLDPISRTEKIKELNNKKIGNIFNKYEY